MVGSLVSEVRYCLRLLRKSHRFTATVVLTHSLWQSAYGADPDVLGQSITLNARDYEIVGVLSPEFVLSDETFPTVGGARHLNVLLSPVYSEQEMAEEDGNENWNVFGRMKPGVSIEQVRASMDLVADHVTVK